MDRSPIHVRAYMRVCICICMSMRVCACVCMRVLMCTCVSVCKCVCMCLCVSTYVLVCVCMHRAYVCLCLHASVDVHACVCMQLNMCLCLHGSVAVLVCVYSGKWNALVTKPENTEAIICPTTIMGIMLTIWPFIISFIMLGSVAEAKAAPHRQSEQARSIGVPQVRDCVRHYMCVSGVSTAGFRPCSSDGRACV